MSKYEPYATDYCEAHLVPLPCARCGATRRPLGTGHAAHCRSHLEFRSDCAACVSARESR